MLYLRVLASHCDYLVHLSHMLQKSITCNSYHPLGCQNHSPNDHLQAIHNLYVYQCLLLLYSSTLLSLPAVGMAHRGARATLVCSSSVVFCRMHCLVIFVELHRVHHWAHLPPNQFSRLRKNGPSLKFALLSNSSALVISWV